LWIQRAILEEDIEAGFGAAEARSEASFLARDGFHGSLDTHPGQGEVHVSDVTALFGIVQRKVEAADRVAVGAGVEVFEQDVLPGVVQEAGTEAQETTGVDAADGEFFEAVALQRFGGFVEIEVLGERALNVAIGIRVVVEGGIGDVDAEFEGISGSGAAACFCGGSCALLSIATVRFDLLAGGHRRSPFEEEVPHGTGANGRESSILQPEAW
jgi:hypothetical protein